MLVCEKNNKNTEKGVESLTVSVFICRSRARWRHSLVNIFGSGGAKSKESTKKAPKISLLESNRVRLILIAYVLLLSAQKLNKYVPLFQWLESSILGLSNHVEASE